MDDDRYLTSIEILKHAFSQGICGLIRNLRERGARYTAWRVLYYIRLVRSTALNHYWDRKHGVETTTGVSVSDLEDPSNAKDYAVFYAPSPRSVIRFLLNQLNLDYERFQFVDFGAGKGKVLLLAAEYPFQQITGVEFAGNLVEIAKSNIAGFKSEQQRCKQIELQHIDAQLYTPENRPCVHFFYSPFHSKLLNTVLENIRQSTANHPRETLICFLDDVVGNAQTDRVNKVLSNWKHWEVVHLPEVPLGWDALYRTRLVVYRTGFSKSSGA